MEERNTEARILENAARAASQNSWQAESQNRDQRARDAVREQYRRIVETQRECQAAIVAIAQVMDWGPAQLNQIIGAPFFEVPPQAPLPPASAREPEGQA